MRRRIRRTIPSSGAWGGLVGLSILFLAIFGWCWNVVKIFGLMGGSWDEVGVELIVRGISAFFFIPGVIAGYL